MTSDALRTHHGHLSPSHPHRLGVVRRGRFRLPLSQLPVGPFRRTSGEERGVRQAGGGGRLRGPVGGVHGGVHLPGKKKLLKGGTSYVHRRITDIYIVIQALVPVKFDYGQFDEKGFRHTVTVSNVQVRGM